MILKRANIFSGLGKYKIIAKGNRERSMWQGKGNTKSYDTVHVHTSDTDWNKESENLWVKECEEGLLTASRLLQEGIQQQKEGNFAVAMASLKESWQKFQELGDVSQQTKALYFLALVAYNCGDYKIAISYGKECLSLEPEANIQQQALSCIGNAYRHLADYESAIKSLHQCLEIVKHLDDKKSLVATLNNLGLAYKFAENLPLAIEFHEQSLSILQELQERWGEEQVLKNLGNAYYSLGDYNQAIAYYQRSIQIAYRLNKSRSVIRLLKNLATAYYALGDYAQVIVYYEQRLKLARDLKDKRSQEQSLKYLGITCETSGDYRKAITYHEQRLKLARETQDSRSEKQTLASLKAAYYALGEYTEVVAYDCE